MLVGNRKLVACWGFQLDKKLKEKLRKSNTFYFQGEKLVSKFLVLKFITQSS